mmetsp:Transcript_37908/g.42296  ORF Transcript_37908/g.42296 Transcript_37908/m.42296 type:complete len:82 (+) Transcript_37908:165-410(+)
MGYPADNTEFSSFGDDEDQHDRDERQMILFPDLEQQPATQHLASTTSTGTESVPPQLPSSLLNTRTGPFQQQQQQQQQLLQ